MQAGLIADIVYKTKPNFLTHSRKLTIDVSKICFPRCFSCKKIKTPDAINATPSPNPTPKCFWLRLHSILKVFLTHGMMAACLRDILIYSLPRISISSHPNTIHHSRLNVCLIDYVDLNPCLSIVFWLSACEYTGSCDFAFEGAVEILSLGLRLQHQNYRMIALYKRHQNNKLIDHKFNYL